MTPETRTLRELREADGPGERLDRVTQEHNPVLKAGQSIELAFENYRDSQQKPGWRAALRKRGLSRKQIERIGRRARQKAESAQGSLDAAIRRDITRRAHGLQA